MTEKEKEIRIDTDKIHKRGYMADQGSESSASTKTDSAPPTLPPRMSRKPRKNRD